MTEVDEPNRARNALVRMWRAAARPSRSIAVGVLLIAGFAAGIVFWGGYNWAMELSNTEVFCVSCHEMRNTVFKELKESPHFSNPSGVRATCADCHVPRAWQHKFVRKIRATNELMHKMLGSIDTPEKFEAKRLELARNVWKEMKATDSRECRNCHDFAAMNFEGQNRLAKRQHGKAIEKGETCIDCHKGIAHKLPKDWDKAS